jgi:hypothetical protein
MFPEQSSQNDQCLKLADNGHCRNRYGTNLLAACCQILFRGMIQVGEGSTVGGLHRRAEDSELLSQFDAFKTTEELLKQNFLEAVNEMSKVMERMNSGTEMPADSERWASASNATKCQFEMAIVSKITEHVQDSLKGRSFFIT